MELRGDNGIAGRIISFSEANEKSGREEEKGASGDPVTQAGNCLRSWVGLEGLYPLGSKILSDTKVRGTLGGMIKGGQS